MAQIESKSKLRALKVAQFEPESLAQTTLETLAQIDSYWPWGQLSPKYTEIA